MNGASLPTEHNTQTYLWSLTVLDQVSAAVGQSLILESILDAGLTTLIEAFDFEAGAVVMRHPNHQLHIACQVGDLPAALESWLVDEMGGGQVMTEPGPIAWPQDARHPSWSPGLIQPGHSLVCAPIQVEGESLGVVALTANRLRDMSPVKLATLEQASGKLALAVRNALRYHQAARNGDGTLATPSSSERDHSRVTLLYQVARELGGQLDTDQLLDQILALAPRLGAQFAYIIIEEKDGTLHFRSTAPGREEFVGAVGRRLARRTLQYGVEGWVLEHRQSLLIADTLTDDRWYQAPYLLEIDRSALCVPLHMERAGARGTWTLTSWQPGAFHADDVPLAESVAAQVAVALENTLLFRAESERSLHLSLINDVSQAAASILSLGLMLSTVTQAIQRRFGYLRVSIFLVDAEAGMVRVRSQAGAYGEIGLGYQQRLGEGLVGQAAQESRTKLANDVSQYPGYLRLGPHAEAIRAELAIPIRLGSKVIGVLDLQSREIDAFRPQDVATMELLADQLSIAIENARLYGEIRQRIEELTTLNKISQAITSTLDLQETLTVITDHTTRLLGVAATSVVLYDEAGDDLWFAAASGEGSEYVLGMRLAIGQGIAGWVFEHGQPVLVPDTSKDTRWFSGFDRDSGFTTRSILCVPLQAKGQTIGAIEAINKESGPFDQEDLRLLSLMAAPAATAIENAKLYEALRQGMRKLEETQEQLVQTAKLAAVGELAAGVAHEINNPLTSIIGFTRLLLDDLPVDHQIRADLETIDREAARTRQIVRTLLDFARASDPVLAPADLNALIEEAVMLVCTRSVMVQISLEKDLSSMPPIMLDINQIKQVLVNLLNNAVQAMPDGGHLTLASRLTEREIEGVYRQMAAVYVSDSGVGIPPEDLDRIFDPFFTTKEVGQGTGLGLSVSYSIVEKHNGRIEVESMPGEGSTFVVLLPIDDDAQRSIESQMGIKDRE